MRPTRLVMQAFGPYAAREDIDLRPLSAAGFLLIHGSTGAGKTTILDAICYALYGRPVTDRRDARQMRSQYADAATPTEVMLEFSLHGRNFRATRRPSQDRAKQRGEGMITVNPEATLWDRTDAATETDEGRVLSTGDSKVTAEVERLLGFNAEQFCQVVILPQGRFRELLVANSTEREAILKVLFGTHRFERLQVMLDDRRKVAEADVRGARDRQATLLAGSGLEAGSDPGGALATLRAAAGELAGRKAAAEISARSAAKALSDAEALDKLFVEASSAEEALAGVMDALPRAKEGEVKLARARAAAPLEPLALEATQRAAEAAAANQEAAKSTAELQDAERAAEVAKQKLVAEEGHRKAREELAREIERIDESLVLARELEIAKEESTRLGASASTAKRKHAEAIAARDAQDAAIRALRDDERVATKGAGELAACESALVGAKKTLDAWDAWSAARKARERLASAHDAATSELEARAKEFESQKKALDGARHRFEVGQAAVLARGLVEGAPCPVCGATHHPHPATGDVEPPTRESLDGMAAKLAEVEAELARSRDAAAAAAKELAAAESRERTQGEALGAAAALERVELARNLSEAERALANAQSARTRLAEIVGKIANAESDLAARTRAVAEAAKGEAEATTTAAGAAGAVAERERKLPAERRDAKGLALKRDATSKRVAELDAAFAAAVAAEKSAREALAAATAKKTSTAKAEAEATKRSAEVARRFALALTGAGFTDEATFRAAVLGADAVAELETKIARFQELKAKAEGRAESARLGIASKTRPELEPLREADALAATALALVIREQGENAERIAGIERLRQQLETAREEEASAQARFEAIAPIAAAANGRPPNTLNISFQRWALGALLDDVLVFATQRLRILSRGRYRLQRVLAGNSRSRSVGLDLEVEDAYTGLSRPVGTLSGGESFQAALALALGLADVVQRQSGGTELGTIFIDEGFGSLDPEALDAAMTLLQSLRSGNRLVVIISHVGELQQVLDTRLEIRSSDRGSTTRSHLG